jgi:hypothetical protein
MNLECGEMYLEDFGIVSSPRITENPIAGIILVVDFDLAINRASSKAVTIVVESRCCNHVSVAMVQELESVRDVVERIVIFFLCWQRICLLRWGRLFLCWRHCSFYCWSNGWRSRRGTRRRGEAG